MDRLVAVYRHTRTGAYLLHPYGTFLGLGAFAGLKIYREVRADAPCPALGVAVVDLLERSLPTGFHIRDAEEYQRTHPPDAESLRVMKQYSFPRRSMLDLHRKFTITNVEVQHGYKSWWVCPKVYDWSRRGVLTGDLKRAVRLRISKGPAELDQLLRAILLPPALPKPRTRKGAPNPSLQRTRYARR